MERSFRRISFIFAHLFPIEYVLLVDIKYRIFHRYQAVR